MQPEVLLLDSMTHIRFAIIRTCLFEDVIYTLSQMLSEMHFPP